MCGILGYSGQFSGNFSEALHALDHRGPDDSGTYFSDSNSLALGHTRLSILDLSEYGHQPMVSRCGKVSIVFNGEIYNFAELRDDLVSKGYIFKGTSDTEVLLNLYLDCGEDFMSKLNGIFALAIWDSRVSSLLVVRDHIGVKPLYFYCDSLLFAFASEIKSLIHLVPPSIQLDFPALQSYLTFLYSPGSSTPFHDFRKLPPGQALLIKDGSILKQWQWYTLPVFSKRNYIHSLDSCMNGVVHHLRSAVSSQLVSDVPVGCFLSGGLDSSSIVALARDVVPDIPCFTIDVRNVDDEGFSDDLPFARRVASFLDVPLHVVKADAQLMAAGIERMVWQLDEPLADPAALNVLFISTLAQEMGIKVLLSGAGGDDLFTGYRRHLALDSEYLWSWLPRSIRVSLRSIFTKLPPSITLTRRLAKAFSGAHLSGDARLINYFRWISRADLYPLFTSEFRHQLGNVDADCSMLEFLSELPAQTTQLERMLSLEQRFFLVDHNLTYTDKMSMAKGVEVRVPFLDRNLVEFASCIPQKFKQRGRCGKWILKKSMENYLPRDVIYRPKSGFGAPLRRWLRVELRDWLLDTLSYDRLCNRGLFEPHAVHRLIEANSKGTVDASYTLLSLACIEIWCTYFIDRSPVPKPKF